MKIAEAIKLINPNAEFNYHNNDIDNIEWLNGTPPISVEDIKTKIAELPTAEEDRQAEADLKASAKAKLMAGEPMTEEEANFTLHIK